MIITKDIELRILRKNTRYLLRRIKTQKQGGEKHPKLPKGFKKSFEDQDKFRGWDNYQITWDVYHDNPKTIKLLDKSLEAQWNELLLNVVPELPNGTESNIRSD